MAGRPNFNSTGGLRSTYGVGAYQASSRNNAAVRPLGKADAPRILSNHFNPTGRTSGGNSYSGGHKPGAMAYYPSDARAVRSAGYGQGKLQMGGASNANYKPNAPYHVGTPANLQRKQFDNWSAKKRSGMGDFGSASNVVYWGDYKARDERMRSMRAKYELNEDRRSLIREAYSKLDTDGDGIVTLADVSRVYNASAHPMVKAKQWSEEQAFLDFMARFKGGSYEPGRTQACLALRLDEFEKYYEGVGADLDDEYFEAMMIQAWRLHKIKGHMPAQGWGAAMLDDLALAEANMMGDEYRGVADLNAKKLDGIEVTDEAKEKIEGWSAKVRSGGFQEMLSAAEGIAKWCGEREAIGALANLAPMLANAVRFVRLGGSSLLVSLAEAQDVLIKRACSSALFVIFSDELPRLELARCDVRWTQTLVRDGLPALCGCADIVVRNKAERVRAMLV